ncbi:substrate-binding periplasmic protein [Salidesulfovibrio brasiliensis]|uniref:substrate-binding periplasmic protein n=1 Tax=Salidesulfovibrio brasiliensis TaxID=221711 RepID=UPI0006D22CC0|nr:transporter substrate-binding domain-containing protein [Salidesulfovibrio brasiliensis]
MKSTIHTPACVLSTMLATALLLAALTTVSLAAGPPMRIAFPEYDPFFSRNEHGEMTGFFHDIVMTALARIGVSATWKQCPWKRCQQNVAHGDADAMITVPTKERLQYCVTHEDPFYTKEMKVFTYKGHPKIAVIRKMQTINDILKNDLSVITYIGNGWNRTHIQDKGIKTYETPYLENVWTMLANQRGDLAIEWPYSAWKHIRKTGVGKDLEETEVVLDAMEFHLMVGKRSPFARILPRFNKTIAQMKQNGEIDAIIKKHVR